jgi:hypothetical protein
MQKYKFNSYCFVSALSGNSCPHGSLWPDASVRLLLNSQSSCDLEFLIRAILPLDALWLSNLESDTHFNKRLLNYARYVFAQIAVDQS